MKGVTQVDIIFLCVPSSGGCFLAWAFYTRKCYVLTAPFSSCLEVADQHVNKGHCSSIKEISHTCSGCHILDKKELCL